MNEIFLGAENEEKFSNYEYLNVLVSFWIIDINHKKTTACLGASIKSNVIFLTKECNTTLVPRSDVTIRTGKLSSREIYLNSFLEKEGYMPKTSKFMMFFVSSSI